MLLALLLALSADAAPPKGMSADVTFTQVTLGESHGCGRTPRGLVRCWGRNDRGQLGTGTFDDSRFSQPVEGLVDIVALAAGSFHTCAVTRDRKLWCWGDNQTGQLGAGTLSAEPVPVHVADIGPVLSVAAGASHTCAVTTDKGVSCWGNNLYGQLGQKGLRSSPRPIPVAGVPPMTDIAAGYGHTCAIGPTEQIPWCWGDGTYGQLGRALPEKSDPQGAAPIEGVFPEALRLIDARGYETCVLHGAGVQCWGAPPTDLRPQPAVRTAVDQRNLLDLSVGWGHACALETGGSVVCWGDDRFGQLGKRDRTRPVVFGAYGVHEGTSVAAGNGESCAARGSDLRTVCWGTWTSEERAAAAAEKADLPIVRKPRRPELPPGTELMLSTDEILSHEGARIRVDIETVQVHTCANTKLDATIEEKGKRVIVKLGEPFLPGGDCMNAPAPAHAYVPLPSDAIGRRDLIVRYHRMEDFFQIFLRMNKVEIIPLAESKTYWVGDKTQWRVPPGSLAISCTDHLEDPLCERRARDGLTQCLEVLQSDRITKAPLPEKLPESSSWFTSDPDATVISPDEGHEAYRTWFEEGLRDGSQCLDIRVRTWRGETWRNIDPRNGGD
ncbi:MAG: hypothetical protein H6732_19250 [Alphaproteobacteria bacterium]|nr:hypothetical protein [Alphaproteobacteria bacterium]